MKLSATQSAALKMIVSAFDVANEREIRNWGKPLSGGIDLGALAIRDVTVLCLERAGMIEIQRANIPTERLRRGAYGRWIGGSIKGSYVHLSGKPTDLGRKTAE